jgi:hypothetical protein
VKFTPLLATPPTVTTTFPVVAPVGTVTTMLVALQLVAVAAVPLNLTVLVPCVAPKLAPEIVTVAPTNPDVGFRLVMLGAAVVVTVKFTPLLATPPTVTTTFPVVAPVGTVATMLVVLQFVVVATVPLNLTVLVPCVGPKFAPVMVTATPTDPDVGFRLVMLGAAVVTVKVTPALATPPTVTTTFPVVAPVGTVTTMLVALQLVAVAATPLNVTVLAPNVAPKFAPVMVTDDPIAPDVGLKLVMPGVVPLSAGLLGVADSTKPEHPVKTTLASARTHSTRAHTRRPFFSEFAPEQILVNIFSFPRCRRLHPSCGRTRPHADSAYGEPPERRNWTWGEKEGRCVYTTLHCPQGQAGMQSQPSALA